MDNIFAPQLCIKNMTAMRCGRPYQRSAAMSTVILEKNAGVAEPVDKQGGTSA
jgi:hypothetical protein